MEEFSFCSGNGVFIKTTDTQLYFHSSLKSYSNASFFFLTFDFSTHTVNFPLSFYGLIYDLFSSISRFEL